MRTTLYHLDHLMLGEIVKGLDFFINKGKEENLLEELSNIVIKSISPVPSKVQKTNTTLNSQQQFSATIFNFPLYASNNAACAVLPYCSMCK